MTSLLTLGLLAFLTVSSGTKTAKSGNGKDIYGPPQNIANEAGVTVTIVCRSDNPDNPRIMWAEFATNPSGAIISDGTTILPGYPNQDRYRIIHDTDDQYDLEITKLVLEDGGLFVCQDVNLGSGVYRGKAENTVLAGPPNCTNTIGSGVVIEGSSYTMECDVVLQGNQKPLLTWSGPGPFQSATGSTPTTVWSGILFVADRGMIGGSFSCLTNFTIIDSPPDDSTATNAPEYTFTYTSVPIQVLWPPKNMYAVPSKPSYNVGDVITCHADANPTSIYSWQNLRTGQIVSSDQNFEIDSTYEGWTTAMRCVAQNSILGVVYNTNLIINITVGAPTTTPVPTTTPSTTPALPQSSCDDLTGRWNSYEPNVVACLEVNTSTGFVYGIARNATDPFFIEINGYSVMDDYTYVGFCGIWPFESAAFCFAGECHKCYGDEFLTANALTRAKANSPSCGNGSPTASSQQFTFQRTGPPCRGAELKVRNPTKITTMLGVKVATDVERWADGTLVDSAQKSGKKH
jgi:hypothetical protein